MSTEALRELYQEVILDHGRHPRNFRHPPDANHQAHGNNPLCGDRVTVYLKLSDDGMVEDAAFEGRGCAISQASASMMTELVRGRPEREVRALFDRFHALCTGGEPPDAEATLNEDDQAHLQVMAGVRQFPMRVKCATLPWHTLIAALDSTAQASSE